MATLKRIDVNLHSDKTASASTLHSIISHFMPNEWPSVDPNTLKITPNTSFTNLNYHVQRLPPSTLPTEPLKLFIKFHSAGGFDVFKHLVPSKAAEATLCHEYAQTGKGAFMYGFFQTSDGTFGRIDEFLDARNMQPEDVEDEHIRADVAEAMAAFYTMRTSIALQPVGAFYKALLKGLRGVRGSEKLKGLGRECGVEVDQLLDYDFASRVEGVVTKLDGMTAKEGLCIHDVQFMNTLIKNKPAIKGGESKIVLIDFEFVLRNYRAFDIGGHFMQKLFNRFDEVDKIADCRPYTQEEKRHFCCMYAEQWNESTGDEDTAEQVLREAELGYLLAISFDVHNMLSFMGGRWR